MPGREGERIVSARRAIIYSSGSRYLVLLLQIASTFVVAHQVRPDQFGLTVIGGGVLMIAEALRELGSAGYLVQQRELKLEQVRSGFTLALGLTLLVGSALYFGAPLVAAFYRESRLVAYLHVMVLGYLLGPFVAPIQALMSRDLGFHRIAAMDVTAGLVNAATAVTLARLGFGFMSVAWASVAGGAAAMLLGLLMQRDFRIYRPSLAHWRAVLTFGVHGSAAAMVFRLGEAMLYLALGRVIAPRSIALLQRGVLITQLPERVVLAGVTGVAMPAFAALVRQDRPLVPAYLHGIRLIAPVYLTAMLVLVPLAPAIVHLVLGPQWAGAVPVVQIIAAGHLFGFVNVLSASALIAAGGIRRVTPLALIQMGSLIAAALVAAPWGVTAIAWTAFVTSPVGALASLLFARGRVPFPWRGLAAAVGPALPVTAAALAGPALVALATDWATIRPLLALMVGATTCGLGWLGALAATNHPLLAELREALPRSRRRPEPEFS